MTLFIDILIVSGLACLIIALFDSFKSRQKIRELMKKLHQADRKEPEYLTHKNFAKLLKDYEELKKN